MVDVKPEGVARGSTLPSMRGDLLEPSVATTDVSSTLANSSQTAPVWRLNWVFPSVRTTHIVGQHCVGRDASCDSVLVGTEVSRKHAEFRLDGSRLAVRDLRSSNGLFVNSVRREDALLEPGDVVRCGEWVAIVAREAFSSVGFGEIAPGWYGGETIRTAVTLARKAATTDLPIVVQGATGTGKEGLARAIHAWSGRSGRFVAVNCAALPAHIAEGELFGYRKGAFTGADRSSPGLFRAAQGGTIFLDEILDLPLEVQPKLLRVLEQREVLPLGEVSPVPTDARIIVAAQESLFDAAEQGRFRSDLYARLDGLVIDLPLLRDRKEDIGPLFTLLVKEYGGQKPPRIEPRVIEALCLYDWPLNVRELVLLARQLLATHGDEQVLKRAHVPDRIVGRARVDGGAAGGQPKRSWRKTDDQSDLKTLLEALKAHAGNVARAAEAVGVSRARAYRLLRAHPELSIEALGRDR